MYRGGNIDKEYDEKLKLCKAISVDHLKQLIDKCYNKRRYYYVGETVEQGCNARRNQHVKEPKERYIGKMYYILVNDRFQIQEDLIKYGKDKDEKEKMNLCRNKYKKYGLKTESKTRGQVYVVILCEQWIPA
jgi:hypothetical protein